MITVRSTFALTVDAMAESNGPYVVDAGAPISFIGGPAAPDTDYFWDFGDGATATGSTVGHTYADDGLYVAKLRTVVNQPGGVETRHFARVLAENVPPVIDPLPSLEVDEGQEFEFVAGFSDQEWPDTHTAVIDFGDDSLPVEATVSETNTEPRAVGTVRAKHAYCDNGTYTVTVKVMDDDGGVAFATTEIRVRNVDPTVDAGIDLYAYPCTPLTLVATFTDPGWCDTHTATWDFGDCTPLHPAVVREEHEPPAATGIAVATHTFDTCGNLLAVCEVTDDDGGIGSDTTVVRVVDVVNGDFEGGFRNRLPGTVANGWQPYGTKSTAARDLNIFAAEEFVVHSGLRSQSIRMPAQASAGLYQKVGANPGWDYQVSVWYHIDEGTVGSCRLGVDPAGRADPSGADVVWSDGDNDREWIQLVVRAVAEYTAITIFVEVSGTEDGTVVAYFDDVVLAPFPCPVTFEEPPELPTDRVKCVDWRAERAGSNLGQTHEREGFLFRTDDPRGLQIVTWGVVGGEGKLAFPVKGVEVTLPFPSTVLEVTVGLNASQAITVEAFDAAGDAVDRATADPRGDRVQTLELFGVGITTLFVYGGDNEGVIIEICARSKQKRPEEDKPRRPREESSW
jgi:PKD repeat protein